MVRFVGIVFYSRQREESTCVVETDITFFVDSSPLHQFTRRKRVVITVYRNYDSIISVAISYFFFFSSILLCPGRNCRIQHVLPLVFHSLESWPLLPLVKTILLVTHNLLFIEFQHGHICLSCKTGWFNKWLFSVSRKHIYKHRFWFGHGYRTIFVKK